MGVIKDINVDGKVVRFKASAAIPRLYRMMKISHILWLIMQMIKSQMM